MRGPGISSFVELYGEIIDWLVDQTNNSPAAMKLKARCLSNQLNKFRFNYNLQLLDSYYLVTNTVHMKCLCSEYDGKRGERDTLNEKFSRNYNALFRCLCDKDNIQWIPSNIIPLNRITRLLS